MPITLVTIAMSTTFDAPVENDALLHGIWNPGNKI
jgi:hypothetical protein